MVVQRNLFYALLLCSTFLMHGMRTKRFPALSRNSAAHTMQMMEGLKANYNKNYFTSGLEERIVDLQRIYGKQKVIYTSRASLSAPGHQPITLQKKQITGLPDEINRIHNIPNNFNISGMYRVISTLNLSCNNLTAFDLVPFAACPYLTKIDLSYNKITALAFRSNTSPYRIVSNNHLTELNLAANEFSTIDMDRFFEAIPNMRSLDLSDNHKLKTITAVDNPVTMWPVSEEEFELDRHKQSYPYLPTISITNTALNTTQITKLTTWYAKKLGALHALSAQHNRERGGIIAAVGIVAGIAPIGLLDNFDMIIASHPLLIVVGYGTLIAGCISVPLACCCYNRYDAEEREASIVQQKIWSNH